MNANIDGLCNLLYCKCRTDNNVFMKFGDEVWHLNSFFSLKKKVGRIDSSTFL